MPKSYMPINIRNVHIDWAAISASLEKSPKVREKGQRESERIIIEKVNNHHPELMSSFEKHIVTKELDPDRKSSTLLGTGRYGGNLFSYVGFHEGSDPVGEIRRFLERSIKVDRSRTRKTSGKLSWRVYVKVPDMDDFTTANVASIPWMAGTDSFVYHITQGIPGVERYIYSRQTKRGRSGQAVQGKEGENKLSKRSSLKTPQHPYVEELLKDFIAGIQS